MANITHQRDFLRETHQKVSRIMERHLHVVLYYGTNPFNLPMADQVGKVVSWPGHDHGLANKEGQVIGYLDYIQVPGVYGVYQYTPNTGHKVPKIIEEYRLPEIAEATIEVASRRAFVRYGETTVTFPGVDVTARLDDIMDEINKELARLEMGIWVWKAELVPDPDPDSKPFPNGMMYAKNGQVSVPVTGYAYDQAKNLVYLGVVGYKTSLESLRATLVQRKSIALSIDGDIMTPCGTYTQVWQPLPEYSSHHSVWMTNQALPGKWTPEDTVIYLLAFRGEDPAVEIKRQFAARLNEALEVPIIPEWTDALWEAGKITRFIQKLTVGGDCIAGVSVQVAADWNHLVETLLESGKIVVA
jgi:hypothetical protein